jgi:8-oxo-dGTP pyrophosphatase MutT (NUDIX family)
MTGHADGLTGAGLEERLRGAGSWLGASCLPWLAGRGFLLAAQSAAGSGVVLGGIGGKVEPGETFEEAVRREYEEETGTAFGRLVEVPEPVYLGAPAEPSPPRAPNHAAALISRRPAEHPARGVLWIAMFLCVVRAEPRPVEKIPYFMVIDPRATSQLGTHQDIRQARDGLAYIVAAATWLPSRPAAAALEGVSASNTAAAVLARPDLLAGWADRCASAATELA